MLIQYLVTLLHAVIHFWWFSDAPCTIMQSAGTYITFSYCVILPAFLRWLGPAAQLCRICQLPSGAQLPDAQLQSHQPAQAIRCPCQHVWPWREGESPGQHHQKVGTPILAHLPSTSPNSRFFHPDPHSGHKSTLTAGSTRPETRNQHPYRARTWLLPERKNSHHTSGSVKTVGIIQIQTMLMTGILVWLFVIEGKVLPFHH